MIEPKGVFDRAKKILSGKKTGRVFLFVKNNGKNANDSKGSWISLRTADCFNNEILIQTQDLSSCSFGSGDRLQLPSGEGEESYLNKWIRVPTGSKENQVLRLICAK
jgi:hypothetical protein